MDFVTGQQMMVIVESGWEEGGFAAEGQAHVARVKLGPIECRIHGEWENDDMGRDRFP